MEDHASFPSCRDSIGEPFAEMTAVQGAGMRSTGFGATGFEMAADVAPPRRAGPDSVFDVCHVGVVLRALLYVHGVMAIGMVFAAPSFAGWLGLTAAGSSVALPGVLIWLLSLCALKRPLAVAPIAVQWFAAIGFGAVAAWLTSTLIAVLLVDASGAGLSDHDGYLVRYRLTWTPTTAQAAPAPAAVHPQFREGVGVKVSFTQ